MAIKYSAPAILGMPAFNIGITNLGIAIYEVVTQQDESSQWEAVNLVRMFETAQEAYQYVIETINDFAEEYGVDPKEYWAHEQFKIETTPKTWSVITTDGNMAVYFY